MKFKVFLNELLAAACADAWVAFSVGGAGGRMVGKDRGHVRPWPGAAALADPPGEEAICKAWQESAREIEEVYRFVGDQVDETVKERGNTITPAKRRAVIKRIAGRHVEKHMYTAAS